MSAVASEATIRIAYDGDALQSGTMDVRDLAPALLALSDLFDGANKVLNGPDRAIQLRIRHDVKRGSFDVGIQVVQTWASKIVSLFAGDAASSAANLIEILGFAIGAPLGLLKLIKWLRGRAVQRVELLNDNGARLIVEGDEIIISRPLAMVFNDLGVRRALAAVMSPLNRDGIDSFVAKTADGVVVEQVAKDERGVFSPPDAVDTTSKPINISEFKQAYTIVSVTFKDGNKWRVSDGQSTIAVTIEDADFLRRVNNHDVSFVKDDVIRCEVRQEQSMTPSGLKTEVFVKRVLEHQHTYRQMILPMSEAATVRPALPPVERAIGSGDEVLAFSAPQSNEETANAPSVAKEETAVAVTASRPLETNSEGPRHVQPTDISPSKPGPKKKGAKRKR
ncbi:hypothetical protein [Polyangium spumosum]|uniref:Uncharacterized protein n=1 Tax=Polyangium spumosum TaxID=889282 RepID=A0A6N7PY10_9BACT|nr:hypothetical protein [Polyangium spumosum]MRG95766.1 hypothetical protein [Polyangium spumosum]